MSGNDTDCNVSSVKLQCRCSVDTEARNAGTTSVQSKRNCCSDESSIQIHVEGTGAADSEDLCPGRTFACELRVADRINQYLDRIIGLLENRTYFKFIILYTNGNGTTKAAESCDYIQGKFGIYSAAESTIYIYARIIECKRYTAIDRDSFNTQNTCISGNLERKARIFITKENRQSQVTFTDSNALTSINSFSFVATIFSKHFQKGKETSGYIRFKKDISERTRYNFFFVNCSKEGFDASDIEIEHVILEIDSKTTCTGSHRNILYLCDKRTMSEAEAGNPRTDLRYRPCKIESNHQVKHT